jgi:hypothetical protein
MEQSEGQIQDTARNAGINERISWRIFLKEVILKKTSIASVCSVLVILCEQMRKPQI